MTGLDLQQRAKNMQFSKDDVDVIFRWKAHMDGINWVTFVPDPRCIASCSFDCNVFLWNTSCEKIGSLVLGAEKLWDLVINKTKRNEEKRDEADDMLHKADSIKYELFLQKKKDDTHPAQGVVKGTYESH